MFFDMPDVLHQMIKNHSGSIACTVVRTEKQKSVKNCRL